MNSYEMHNRSNIATDKENKPTMLFHVLSVTQFITLQHLLQPSHHAANIYVWKLFQGDDNLSDNPF